jgi:hypothetical protein
MITAVSAIVSILLPVRLETLSYPFYLANLMAALQVLPKDLRPQLIERTSLLGRLDTVARRSSGSARRFHPSETAVCGLDETKSLGLGLVLSAAVFATDASRGALETPVARLAR